MVKQINRRNNKFGKKEFKACRESNLVIIHTLQCNREKIKRNSHKKRNR